ncbi:MAG: hypothetical protein AB8G99_14760 [Planctomycetaceae bacterium]
MSNNLFDDIEADLPAPIQATVQESSAYTAPAPKFVFPWSLVARIALGLVTVCLLVGLGIFVVQMNPAEKIQSALASKEPTASMADENSPEWLKRVDRFVAETRMTVKILEGARTPTTSQIEEMAAEIRRGTQGLHMDTPAEVRGYCVKMADWSERMAELSKFRQEAKVAYEDAQEKFEFWKKEEAAGSGRADKAAAHVIDMKDRMEKHERNMSEIPLKMTELLDQVIAF